MAKQDTTPMTAYRNGFTAMLAERVHLDESRALMHRTFFEDFQYPALQPFHDDTLDLAATYVDAEHRALFVAIDDSSGKVIATCAAREWDRRHPQHPDWLHERYQAKRAVELLRCYTLFEQRRRGAQRELIELARRWVVAEGHYEVINLHTNAGIPGAEPFWRSLAYEMHDSRPCTNNTIHFELPLAWPVRGATSTSKRREG